MRKCFVEEDANGQLISTSSGQPFTSKDPCVEHGVTVAYDVEAHRASIAAVKKLLSSTFDLK
jgi:hypothetical protein